jgi:cytochrome c-type protein NapC
MTWSVTAGIVGVAMITILVVMALVSRPGLADSVPGKVFSFLGLFVLPVGVAIGGFQHHMEVSKSTTFCMSCHVMQKYGNSLYVDDSSYLTAAHFQNNRIPREEACYTCHTNYAMFGGVKAKLNGMRHLWVQFTGTIPDEIELYEPYQNRECLHCHAGARSYEETMPHTVMLEELTANESSCLDCHDQAHAVDVLDEKKKWHPG